jgi:hypothetical protein
MPNRYIVIPSPVILLDPATRKPLRDLEGKEEWRDFDFIMEKLLSNPMWSETLAMMRSQDAIHDAWQEAKDAGPGGVMTLAEEDWTKLKTAVETPRSTVMTNLGVQTVVGFGLNPTFTRHLVPLLMPIVDAKTEKPKAKPTPPPDADKPEPKLEQLS